MFGVQPPFPTTGSTGFPNMFGAHPPFPTMGLNGLPTVGIAAVAGLRGPLQVYRVSVPSTGGWIGMDVIK
jgi:hypothetical protein